MSVNIKIDGIQSGLDSLRRELAKFMGDSHVTVGIHEGAAQPEDGSLTMAQLGATLHFGTEDGHIPARPWLDVGVNSAAEEITAVIEKGLAGGKTPTEVLNTAGVVAVGAVQEYMTDLRTPPNAPSTIERKGSDNPLVDSGALRQSITYQVNGQKAPEEGL